MDSVHASAQQGFGQEAETYAHGRPEYPDELLGWLDGSLGIHAGSKVVDLGAGTGKFTRLLLRTGAATWGWYGTSATSGWIGSPN